MAIQSATWDEVLASPGDLTFTRRITGLALTCSVEELAGLFVRAGELPPGRRTWAQSLVAGAWIDRDSQPALAYWIEKRGSIEAEVQQVFYARMALVDPDRAAEELAREPAGEAADSYRGAVIQALAATRPEAALPFLHAMGESAPWLWHGVFEKLARKDRERALVEADKIVGADKREMAHGGILRVWFDSDPVAALRWAVERLPAASFESLAGSLLHDLTRRDSAAARRLVTETGLPAVKSAYASALGSLDEGLLYKTIVTQGWADVPEHALSSLIGHVERLPPEEALSFFKSIPADRLGEAYNAKRVAGAWTLLDPEGAQAWAATITEPELHSEVALRISTMLTELDPKLALAQIEDCPPGPLQSKLVSNTAKALGKKDLPAAIAWVASLPSGPNQAQGFDGLSFIGAEFNPAGMIEGLAAVPAGAPKTGAYKLFAERWANADPGAALDWFLGLPRGPEREAIRQTIFQQPATHAGERALEIVNSLEDHAEQASLVQKIATSLVAEDPASALALIESLPANRESAALVRPVVNELAKQNPELAAAFVLRSAPGSTRRSQLITVAGAWADKDPAAAAGWLDQLRADSSVAEDLPRVAQRLAREWAEHDAARAAAYVQRLPVGRERELAVAGAASGMARRFPSRGFDLLAAEDSTLKNPAQLKTLVKQWRELTPGVADRHIRASSLPDALKDQLLESSSSTP